MAVSPSAGPPKKRSSSILGSFRAAIKKVRFLLSFSATRWMILTSIVPGARPPARRLSFDSRPGLLDVDGSSVSPSPASSRTTSRSASMGTATTRSVSRTSSAASPELLARTSSSGSSAGDDDIDRRAEEFIANFRRQLQMERQVSLQLRYIRGNSWERTP